MQRTLLPLCKFIAQTLLSCTTGTAAGRRSSHQGPLLLRSEFEHVADQQVCLVSLVVFETGGQRAGEHPVIAVALEQTARHSRARSDQSRIGNPALGPGGLQAFFGEQEIGSDGALVVVRVARGMALQARGG